MTFEEYLEKGRNYSSEADYQEYMKLMESQKGMGKAVAKKQMNKAAGSLDIVGSALDLSKATSGFTDSNIAKKYNLNKIDTPDLKSVADFKEFGKQFDAPQTAPVPPTDGGGMFADTSFTGDAKGVAAAGAMAMQTAQSQTAQQAIMGGAMTGLSVGSMLTGAAAGPVGIAVGLGSALVGLSNASSQRRKREKAQEKAKKELEAREQKATELRLLESSNTRRQRAYETLMGAFR